MKVATKIRIPYDRKQTLLYDEDDLVVLRRNKKEKVIKSCNWWINRRTPVGEPAEWFERKPYGGQRQMDPKEIIAILRNEI